MDDESSSCPFPKSGFQTPGTNKRLRSDSDERNEINSQTIYRQNKTPNINVVNQQMTSSDRNEFPPIIVEFTEKHDKSDQLKEKLGILTKDWDVNNRNIALEIIEEWCWTYPRPILFAKWQAHQQHPQENNSNLSLLHYNIRNFYANQGDLLSMIEDYNPHIISINELGTDVPLSTIKKLLFSYDVFKVQGSNTHGGVVIAVDKQFHATAVHDQHQTNIITLLLSINNKSYTVTSVYSPPTEPLPLQSMSEMLKISKSSIFVGDFNAKHEQWGCSLRNKKGRELEQWLRMNNLMVHNQGMTTSLRSKTTIDLIISTEHQFSVQCQPLAYNGSDHIPIMTEFANIPIINRNNPIPKISEMAARSQHFTMATVRC
ncbi:unnamed protein product [Rotaria sp. Silwood2]|nr:unnamed protein product [Rotaria sp. Silwood2]